MFQVDSAWRVPFQTSGCTNSWPLPSCTIFSWFGSASGAAAARPAEVSTRTKCFIDTVSPARSSERSSTLCTRSSGCGPLEVGWLKRQGSMPFCQLPNTKAMSATPLASVWCAVTNRPSSAGQPSNCSSKACAARARPFASVRPFHNGSPWQSWMTTSAPSTGLPRSSEVTHTSAFSRPCLRCTPRLVTSTPVRTNIGDFLSSSDSPRRSDSISTTWKPGSASGMPTTSKGRGSPPASCGSSMRRACASPASSDTSRVATMRSVRCLTTRPLASRSSVVSYQSRCGRPSSCAVRRVSWWRRSFAYQSSTSAAPSTRRTRSWPWGAAGRSSPCTWRNVTGSTASPPSRSRTPKGAEANLASGGASPLATFKGKLVTLASARPALSFSPAGSSIVNVAFSGSGVGKAICCTSSDLSSLSNTGASAVPVAGFRRACAASARGTGAEKPSVIGRIGRQAAPARSRSQLNSAMKGLRTRNSKRCSTVLSTFGLACAAMPRPQTRRSRTSWGSGRWQVASSQRSACFSRRRALITASRAAPVTMLSGTRSPMPSTSHQALAAMLWAVAAPLSCSRKCWSSSIVAPS